MHRAACTPRKRKNTCVVKSFFSQLVIRQTIAVQVIGSKTYKYYVMSCPIETEPQTPTPGRLCQHSVRKALTPEQSHRFLRLSRNVEQRRSAPKNTVISNCIEGCSGHRRFGSILQTWNYEVCHEDGTLGLPIGQQRGSQQWVNSSGGVSFASCRLLVSRQRRLRSLAVTPEGLPSSEHQWERARAKVLKQYTSVCARWMCTLLYSTPQTLGLHVVSVTLTSKRFSGNADLVTRTRRLAS